MIILQVLVIFAEFISWYCCISSIITNLCAECTKMNNYKRYALRDPLSLMGPNFELCCLSLPQFYRQLHDPFYCSTEDSSYVLSDKSALFGIVLLIFDFESQETNRTKILRKLWCPRLQIGVKNVKVEEGTLTYIVFPEIIENEYFVNISLIFNDH